MFERLSRLCAQRRFVVFGMLLTLAVVNANAQSINSATPVRLYYYDFKLSNPAFTGTNAKHAITSEYSSDPGGFGNAQMAYASYEANVKVIQSGIGVISSIQELGITRFSHYGLLYSKYLQVNERSGFYIGTQLAYQRRRTDFSKLLFLDPIDPMNGPQIERTDAFNLTLGIAYYSRIATLGAAFKNVVKGNNETPEYNVLATREFKISKNFSTTPSLSFVTDSKYNTLRINNSFQFFRWVLLGAGYTFPQRGRDNLDLNIGLNIKDRVQLIVHLYASEYRRFRDSNNNERVWAESMIRVRIGDLKKI